MAFDLVVTAAPGGVTVLTVSGDIDMVTAPRLRAELVRLCAEHVGTPRLVLDLVGVDLLDSTGIGAVLEGVKRCSLAGGALVLARAEPQVRRELELTRTADALPVFDTVEDARVALAPPAR